MAHPRTYAESDPFLPEVRRLVAALPETAEVEAWGRPTFRAGKKIFAIFTGGTDEGSFALVFKPAAGERDALLADTRFFVPPYWGPSGWLGLDFTKAPVDWQEVAELLEDSYRHVALKRMLAALDS